MTESRDRTDSDSSSAVAPDDHIEPTGPAARQNGPNLGTNARFVSVWKLVEAVPRRWWWAMLAGALLVAWIALDLPLGNPLVLILAIAAHGCLGIFVYQFYEELRERASHVDSEQQSSGPLWPWLRWLVTIAVLGFVLIVIDGFVWSAPLGLPFRIGYFTLSAVAFLTFLILEFAWSSPRHLRDRKHANLASIALDIARGVAIGALLLLIVLARLAAWRQTDQDDDPILVPTISGSTYDTYVALGDSYSAGEGLEPFLPSPQPNCHRSPKAYPLLLNFDHDVDRTFRACSGAVTHDIDLGIIGGDEPQVHPSPMPDVDLVTITVGGNDVVFSSVVQLCLLYANCAEEKFDPPDEKVGRTTVDFPDAAKLTDWAKSAMDGLARNLKRVYNSLDETYPNARIIVIGYPYLFPAGAAPLNPLTRDCVSLLRRVDENERDTLRTLTDDLNNMLYRVSHRAELEFISPVAAWHEHEPCGDEGQYTYAVKPRLQLLNPVDGATFHPNAQGQRQLARLISCYLNEYPDGPPPYADGLPPGSAVPDSESLTSASLGACSVLLAPIREPSA